MQWKYNPYIPETVSELIDELYSMILESPLFDDDSGYFPGKNIDTEFEVLGKGLSNIKAKLGSDRYLRLVELAAQMRAFFEADPDEKTGDAIKGRDIALDMIEILKSGKSDDYWD